MSAKFSDLVMEVPLQLTGLLILKVGYLRKIQKDLYCAVLPELVVETTTCTCIQ